jgi:hypothetical protein
MGLRPNLADEKRLLFSNYSSGRATPPPCHPVDKPKGIVKGERIRGVAVGNSLAMSLETWRQREPFQ